MELNVRPVRGNPLRYRSLRPLHHDPRLFQVDIRLEYVPENAGNYLEWRLLWISSLFLDQRVLRLLEFLLFYRLNEITVLLLDLLKVFPVFLKHRKHDRIVCGFGKAYDAVFGDPVEASPELDDINSTGRLRVFQPDHAQLVETALEIFQVLFVLLVAFLAVDRKGDTVRGNKVLVND